MSEAVSDDKPTGAEDEQASDDTHPPSGPTPQTYTRTQIGLHWAIVGLVAIQVLFNDAMQIAYDARMDNQEATTSRLWLVHVAAGCLILALMMLRLGLRLTHGSPPPPANNPRLVIWLGAANHLALYCLLFFMPMTGLLAWFGHNDQASELHELGATALIIVIMLHLAGALFEHMVLKQDVFERMIWSARDRSEDGETPD
jgi:cytochrome b561